VLLVSDVRLYREGLAHALQAAAPLAVLGTACGLDEAIDRLRTLGPDVVVLDLTMVDALRSIRVLRAASCAKIVAFAVSDADHQILACAEAGAAAYLSRDGTIEELVRTIVEVMRGETRCSARLAATLFERVAALSVASEMPVAQVLTPREKEIAALLELGLANKAIAHRLGIELATVKHHVHNVLEKLKVERRGEAAAKIRKDYWLGTSRR
jgi:DNA-binding NarL/FixJ family response regulator